MTQTLDANTTKVNAMKVNATEWKVNATECAATSNATKPAKLAQLTK